MFFFFHFFGWICLFVFLIWFLRTLCRRIGSLDMRRAARQFRDDETAFIRLNERSSVSRFTAAIKYKMWINYMRNKWHIRAHACRIHSPNGCAQLNTTGAGARSIHTSQPPLLLSVSYVEICSTSFNSGDTFVHLGYLCQLCPLSLFGHSGSNGRSSANDKTIGTRNASRYMGRLPFASDT